MNPTENSPPTFPQGSFRKRSTQTAFAWALALNQFRDEKEADGSEDPPAPAPTQYELVYSGTEKPNNFGDIHLEKVGTNINLILKVRCGRTTPRKGERKVSANVTENGVNSGKGTKPDGTHPEGIQALVPAMTVSLNKDTGIVTTDGKNGEKSWGDASFGTTVKMTVEGSGTSSVTITYVITGNLTGGTAKTGDHPLLTNPVTITCTYSASKIE